ncbi:MAG: CDP-alcohol phosphatidyltransferase family protein [Candidatus Njordarchaeota archaeon]
MVVYKDTDGIISRYINRKISIRISKLIISKTKSISPNTITFVVSLLGILSALIYIADLPIVAGIMVQIVSILDGVDGEVARLLNKKTKIGGFLDSTLDRFVDLFIILCFSLFTWKHIKKAIAVDMFIILVIMATSGCFFVSFFHARAEATFNIHPAKIGSLPIGSRDVRLFVIFLGSIFGLYFMTLILVCIISYGHVIINTIILCNKRADIENDIVNRSG